MVCVPRGDPFDAPLGSLIEWKAVLGGDWMFERKVNAGRKFYERSCGVLPFKDIRLLFGVRETLFLRRCIFPQTFSAEICLTNVK